MAKKEIDLWDDDLSLDDLDDFGNGDFDQFDPPVDNRSPLTKIAGGVVEEFNPFKNGAHIAGIILKHALPSSYIDAYNLATEFTDKGKEFYDSAVEQTQPVTDAITREGKRLLPMTANFLPSKLAVRVKGFSKEDLDSDEDNSTDFNTTPEDGGGLTSEIDNTLKTIFGAERLDRDLREKKQHVIEKQKTLLQINQFDATQNLTAGIARNIGRLAEYQDKITDKYYRESLKMQYLQYYTLKDILVLSKETSFSSMNLLSGIVKNTGLPNEVKATTSEIFANRTKELLIGRSQDMIREKLSKLPEQIMEGLRNNVNDFTDTVSGAVDAASNMLGGGDEFGEDVYGENGRRIGGFAVNSIGSRVARSLKRKVPRMVQSVAPGAYNAAVGFGSTLKSYTSDWQAKLNERIQDPDADGIYGFLQDIVGDVNGNTEVINHNLRSSATVPVPWDLLSRRTLIEVIPGYFARLLEAVTNTNNILSGREVENDQTVFSVVQEDFIKQSEDSHIASKALRNTFGVGLTENVDAIINYLDPNGTDLSPEERVQLSKQLILDSNSGKSFSAKKYADEDTYTIPDGDKYAELFKTRFNVSEVWNDTTMQMDRVVGNDELATPEENNAAKRAHGDLTEKFARLRDNVGNFSDVINSYYGTGRVQALKELGLVTRDGKINPKYKEELIELYLRSVDSADFAKGSPYIAPTTKSNIFGGAPIRLPNVRPFVQPDVVDEETSIIILPRGGRVRRPPPPIIDEQNLDDFADNLNDQESDADAEVDETTQQQNSNRNDTSQSQRRKKRKSRLGRSLDFLGLTDDIADENVIVTLAEQEAKNKKKRKPKNPFIRLADYADSQVKGDDNNDGHDDISVEEELTPSGGKLTYSGVKHTVKDMINNLSVGNAKTAITGANTKLHTALDSATVVGEDAVQSLKTVGKQRVVDLYNRLPEEAQTDIHNLASSVKDKVAEILPEDLNVKDRLSNITYSDTKKAVLSAADKLTVDNVKTTAENVKQHVTDLANSTVFHDLPEDATKVDAVVHTASYLKGKGVEYFNDAVDHIPERVKTETNDIVDSVKTAAGKKVDQVVAAIPSEAKDDFTNAVSSIKGRALKLVLEQRKKADVLAETNPVLGNAYKHILNTDSRIAELERQIKNKDIDFNTVVAELERHVDELQLKVSNMTVDSVRTNVTDFSGMVYSGIKGADYKGALELAAKSTTATTIQDLVATISGEVQSKLEDVSDVVQNPEYVKYIKGMASRHNGFVGPLPENKQDNDGEPSTKGIIARIKGDIGGKILSVLDNAINKKEEAAGVEGEENFTEDDTPNQRTRKTKEERKEFYRNKRDEYINSLPFGARVATKTGMLVGKMGLGVVSHMIKAMPTRINRLLKIADFATKTIMLPFKLMGKFAESVSKMYSSGKKLLTSGIQKVKALGGKYIPDSVKNRFGIMAEPVANLFNKGKGSVYAKRTPVEILEERSRLIRSIMGTGASAAKPIIGFGRGLIAPAIDAVRPEIDETVDNIKDKLQPAINIGTNVKTRVSKGFGFIKGLGLGVASRFGRNNHDETLEEEPIAGVDIPEAEDTVSNDVSINDMVNTVMDRVNEYKVESAQDENTPVNKLNSTVTNIFEYLKSLNPPKDSEQEEADRAYGVGDLLRRRKEKKEKQSAGKVSDSEKSDEDDKSSEDADSVSFLEMLAGGFGIKAVFDTIVGTVSKVKGMFSGLLNIGSKVGTAFEYISTVGTKLASGLSWLARMLGVASTVGEVAAVGATVAEVGAGAAIAGEVVAGATVGAEVVAGGGMLASGTAMASTLIASAAATTAAAASTAMAAFGASSLGIALASNPVGWAILAGTAIYGGYKAYKYFSKNTELKPLELLRYLQYGVPVNNEHAVISIRSLENVIEDNLKTNSNGAPELKITILELWETVCEDFGSDEDNLKDFQNFTTWFSNRFLPVYVKHTQTAFLFDKTKLADVDDDISADDKQRFVSGVQFGHTLTNNGIDPMGVETSPWHDIPLSDNAGSIKTLSDQLKNDSKRGVDSKLGNLDYIKSSKSTEPKVKKPSFAKAKPEDDNNDEVNEDSNVYKNDSNRNNAVAEKKEPTFFERTKAWIQDKISQTKDSFYDGAQSLGRQIGSGMYNAGERVGHAYNSGRDLLIGNKGSAKLMMKILMEKGWSKAQAAGLAANVAAESGFKIDALGDNGKAYGIAQWHPDRQLNFKRVFGKDIHGSRFEEQVEFLDWELNNTDYGNGANKKAGDILRTINDPVKAAAIVEQKFERSALGLKGGVQQERVNAARGYFAFSDDDIKGSGSTGAQILEHGKNVVGLGDKSFKGVPLSDLPIKSSEATAGGPANEGTMDLARATMGAFGDKIQMFTAFNDAYHHKKSPNSAHVKGLAFDVTTKKATDSVALESGIKGIAASGGVDVNVINEYIKPSKNATGGHVHVNFKSTDDANKFASMFGATTAGETEVDPYSPSAMVNDPPSTMPPSMRNSAAIGSSVPTSPLVNPQAGTTAPESTTLLPELSVGTPPASPPTGLVTEPANTAPAMGNVVNKPRVSPLTTAVTEPTITDETGVINATGTGSSIYTTASAHPHTTVNMDELNKITSKLASQGDVQRDKQVQLLSDIKELLEKISKTGALSGTEKVNQSAEATNQTKQASPQRNGRPSVEEVAVRDARLY